MGNVVKKVERWFLFSVPASVQRLGRINAARIGRLAVLRSAGDVDPPVIWIDAESPGENNHISSPGFLQILPQIFSVKHSVPHVNRTFFYGFIKLDCRKIGK